MAILSTAEVCEKLGVSRAWVNNYIRELGGVQPPEDREMANIRTIYYDEADLLRWLNKNASFSRQTVKLDLCDYAPEDLVRDRLLQIEAMPKVTGDDIERRHEARRAFLQEILPAELEAELHFVIPRKRGLLPWVAVTHSIQRLEDLRSMKDLQEAWDCRSTEMVYREIFIRSMIRVEVCGRRWYMAAPEPRPRHPLTVPAGCLK